MLLAHLLWSSRTHPSIHLFHNATGKVPNFLHVRLSNTTRQEQAWQTNRLQLARLGGEVSHSIQHTTSKEAHSFYYLFSFLLIRAPFSLRIDLVHQEGCTCSAMGGCAAKKSPRDIRSEMAAELFHWEVSILQWVKKHPNVVTLLAVDPLTLSFTMELCDGTLEDGAGEISNFGCVCVFN